MLEEPALLIVHDEEWKILDPETRRRLGVARWRPVRAPLGIGWLARRAVDVFEAEDEPLVFSVQRRWGFSSKWEVCDADGHRVAVLRRGRIQDAFGQDWACMERTGDECRICAGDREFARIRESNDGVHVCFATELQSNPLTKMGLLGAVLIHAE